MTRSLGRLHIDALLLVGAAVVSCLAGGEIAHVCEATVLVCASKHLLTFPVNLTSIGQPQSRARVFLGLVTGHEAPSRRLQTQSSLGRTGSNDFCLESLRCILRYDSVAPLAPWFKERTLSAHPTPLKVLERSHFQAANRLCSQVWPISSATFSR